MEIVCHLDLLYQSTDLYKEEIEVTFMIQILSNVRWVHIINVSKSETIYMLLVPAHALLVQKDNFRIQIRTGMLIV